MQNSDLDFLYLLKCFIHRENPCFDHVPSWEQIKKYAIMNSLEGMIGYMVIKYDLYVDDEDKEYWINKLTKTFGMNYRRYAQADRLLKMLEKNSIDHLTVKGQILKDYYPIKELRSFSDIDILIKIEDRSRLHELLLNSGYKSPVDWEPIFKYKKDTEFYEIHTEIMYENVKEGFDYRQYFSEIWQKAKCSGGYEYRLNPEDHLIYLITHIAKHIGYAGAGIRMYMDLAVLILYFENQLNWEYVFSEMQKIKLSKFTDIAFTAIEKYLGVHPNYDYVREDAELIEKLIMMSIHGGTYGANNQSSGAVMLKKEGSGENISRIAVLKNRLFPTADILEPRYRYLVNRHWLLPIAWAERMFQTRKNFKQNVSKAKDVLTIDKNVIVGMRKFKEDLGL